MHFFAGSTCLVDLRGTDAVPFNHLLACADIRDSTGVVRAGGLD